jgi:hypothetical protein
MVTKSRALQPHALEQFALYVGDPVASVAEATLESPVFAMAHLANGHLHLAGTDTAGVPVAEVALRWSATSP